MFWRGFHKIAREKRKEVSTVAIIHDGKILMGKRRDNGKWTVPGGHLDPGEDPTSGALRETYEESGITLKGAKPLGSYDVPENGYRIHCYKGSVHEKNGTTMKDDPDGEVYRWHWISLPIKDDIRNNMHVPFEKNCLMEAIGLLDKAEGANKLSQEKAAAKVNVRPFMSMSDDVYRQYLRSKRRDEEKRASVTIEDVFASSPIAIVLRKFAKDMIPGGLADKSKPSDFSEEQVQKGIRVELEHTNDRNIAKEIAMDHLKEDPKYYDKLEKIEPHHKTAYVRGVKAQTYYFLKGFNKGKPVVSYTDKSRLG